MSKQAALSLIIKGQAEFGQWPSIKLTNLVVNLSLCELQDLLVQCNDLRLSLHMSRLSTLVQKQAPDVILNLAKKKLNAAKEGRDPVSNIIKREIKKRQVA